MTSAPQIVACGSAVNWRVQCPTWICGQLLSVFVAPVFSVSPSLPTDHKLALHLFSFALTPMTAGNGPMSLVVQGAALVSLVWSCIVFTVQSVGIYKLYCACLFALMPLLLTETAPATATTLHRTRSPFPRPWKKMKSLTSR